MTLLLRSVSRKKQTNPDISYLKTPTGFDEYWWIPKVISLWEVGCYPCWGCHLLHKFLINNLLKWGTGKNNHHLVKDSTYTLLVRKSFVNFEKTKPKEIFFFRRDIWQSREVTTRQSTLLMWIKACEMRHSLQWAQTTYLMRYTVLISLQH